MVMDAPSRKTNDASLTYASVNDLIMLLVRKWKLLLPIILVTTLLALIIYASLPEDYEASATLSPPKEQQDTGGLSSLAGLANLVSDDGESEFEEFFYLSQSRGIILQMEEEMHISDHLLTSSSDLGLLTRVRLGIADTLRQILGHSPSNRESADRLVAAVRDRLSVEKTEQGYIQLKFQHPDPVFAQQFLDRLVTDTDDYIRTLAKRRFSGRLKALEEILKTSALATQQTAAVSIMTQEQTKLISALSDPTYSVREIEPAWVTSEPVLPSIAMVGFLAIAASLVIYVFVIIAVDRKWG